MIKPIQKTNSTEAVCLAIERVENQINTIENSSLKTTINDCLMLLKTLIVELNNQEGKEEHRAENKESLRQLIKQLTELKKDLSPDTGFFAIYLDLLAKLSAFIISVQFENQFLMKELDTASMETLLTDLKDFYTRWEQPEKLLNGPALVFYRCVSYIYKRVYLDFEAAAKKGKKIDPEDAQSYHLGNVPVMPANSNMYKLLKIPDSIDLAQRLNHIMLLIKHLNSPLIGNWLPSEYHAPDLNKDKLKDFLHQLFQLPTGINNVETTMIEIFRYLAYHTLPLIKSKPDYQPINREIVTLMVQLIEPYYGMVYDPECGYGETFAEILTQFSEQDRIKITPIFTGHTTEPDLYCLCRMLLMMHSQSGGHVYHHPKPFSNFKLEDGINANFIITAPIVQPDTRELINHILANLSEHGRAAVLVPREFLVPVGEQIEYINQLIDSSVLECVISLPVECFEDGSKNAILLLGNHKSFRESKPRTILFLNCQTFDTFPEQPNIKNLFLTARLNYDMWRRERDYHNIRGYSKSVPFDRVKELNGLLTPERYVV